MNEHIAREIVALEHRNPRYWVWTRRAAELPRIWCDCRGDGTGETIHGDSGAHLQQHITEAEEDTP